MAEPTGSSIVGGETPEAPQGPEDISQKLKGEMQDHSVPKKGKDLLTELDREVSGEYEAKQERDATR